MKLLDIHILEFGALKDRHFVPGEGLTVIGGENESGKSTLMLFIQFMLYGLPKRGHAERDRAISRDGHRAAGILTVRAGSEDYRIERSYTDGGRGSDKVLVLRCRDGERVFVGEEPGMALLGVPREIFESSSSIGQMQCAGLGGKKEIAAIQNLLTTADETVDIPKIEKRLEDIRVMYRHKKGEGGQISELNRQIHAEQSRLERATENHLRIGELERRLADNKAKLTEVSDKKERAEALLTELSRIDLLRRFEQLHRNEEELARLTEQRATLKQSRWGDAPLPAREESVRLFMLADSLERSDGELTKAAEAVSRLTGQGDWDLAGARLGEKAEQAGGAVVLEERMRRARGSVTLGTVGMVAGAACVLAGVALAAGVAFPLGGAIGAVGAVLAVGALTAFWQGRKKAGALAEAYGTTPKGFSSVLASAAESLRKQREAQSALAGAEAALRTAESHRAHIIEELEHALSRIAPEREVTPQVARQEASRLDTLLADDAQLAQEEKTLREILTRDRALLSVHREEELRVAVGELPDGLSPETVEDARKAKRFFSEQERVLRDTEDRLRIELSNCQASHEDPLTVADRLESLRAERDSCQAYYEAVVTAIEALGQAGETLRGNITPAISRTAGRMMDYISDGRYAELLAGNALSVSLVENGGMSAPSEMLSGGTRDAAYITLRIALMMQIFGEELPPLMMDETLCQVDDRRMKRILALLGKLCENGLQCLLFTCHAREAEACRELDIPFCDLAMR